ncbi:type II secretion system protein [Alkalibacterium kapii]|uniref:Type II secretion system protein n=1 Tax=Alkalibacterium kapii TaxID=426704 RepID=A0A511ATC5_9LACT|nr:type II secretion system protein [Alkalibacterium kapii]GEK91356.1 hypothetical protein AKA01nite_09780 [Alkalibacterium kapii]
MSSNKNDTGFIILESLVSISILAFFVSVVLPFSMEMLIIRSKEKQDVELNRFLYESALFYDSDKPENKIYHSGNVSAHSIETNQSIHIYMDKEKVSGIDYISAEWNLK